MNEHTQCLGCGTGFALHEGRCPICWKDERDILLAALEAIRDDTASEDGLHQIAREAIAKTKGEE
jgi:hypothetical protein